MSQLKLQILIGSTREGRAADKVAPWITSAAQKHGKFEVEVLDLRNWPLPFFAENLTTIGDRANPTFSQPIVKQWNQKIAEGDAFLFITPEYNHSTSGVLKNAIDSVFVTYAFRNKPVGFAGYSGGTVGGARAVEQLVQICFEAEMVPLRDTVLVPQVNQAFGDDGQPKAPALNASLGITLDDLAWWAALLKPARSTQLPTGNGRLMRALAPK